MQKVPQKNPCEAKLTYSLPGFHASQQVVPGSAKACQMTVGSGEKLFALSEKRSRHGSSLRMLEAYLVLREGWYSKTCYLNWKPLDTKQRRLLFQLAPSTPRTEGTESGLLPTSTSTDYKSRGPNSKQIGLDNYFKLLKTPSAVECEGGVMEIRPGANAHYKLRDQIAMLPTPATRDYKGANGPEHMTKGRPHMDQLPNAIAHGTNRGLKLQPAFVEYLMGYPIGWTDLNHSETP